MKQLRVGGVVRAASDKSISHRALMLAAAAKGKSRITRILDSADVQSTARCLRALGADIPPLSQEFVVTGPSARQLKRPTSDLDCGNSGTSARLLAGMVAGAGLEAKFVGDASLSRRPMRRVAEPLSVMGALVALGPHGGLPMTIRSVPLKPIDWTSKVASAQVKSCVLLAAVIAGVPASVTEPHRSRDHTERMLWARGVNVHVEDRRVEVDGGQIVLPADVAVPADPSSAAYFAALAVLADVGALTLADVCLNPTRTGFFEALKRMGGRVEAGERREEGGEIVGALAARPSQLRGIEVSPNEVPSMIDELPLLACVAARANGETVVRGAAELRVKESDRIATIVANLRALGASAEELPDGFRVLGGSKPLRGRVETHGDHRIAMAFGVLGAHPGNSIQIADKECVSVSYPAFWNDLASVVQ